MLNKLGRAILLPLFAIFLAGCPGDGSDSNPDDLLIIGDGSDTKIEPVDPNTVVCDPFTSDPDHVDNVTRGLKASLYYREDGQPRYYSAQDYFDFTTEYEELFLYLSHLDIPTRPFDRGFVTEGGLELTTVNGDTLYEYFALDFHSRLTLAEGDSDGLYQIAVLSDDGSVLEFDYGSGLEIYIDNDGDHPTRMGCGMEPVALTSTSALPMRLKYYQGPRFHISLVVMYRPWDEVNYDDPFCGRQGNSFYFDYTQDPVEPTDNYQALLDRGWKVLTPDHFLLPDPGEVNPCVDPDEPDPEVLDISLGMVDRTAVIINWTTNTATTSQLRLVNLSSGTTTFTPVDSTLVTDHSVAANGLQANTVYEITAISTDAQGRTVNSPLVTVRTRR